MLVVSEKLEIRGIETKISASTNKPYNVIHCESEKCEFINLCAMKTEIVGIAKRGDFIYATLNIVYGKYTNVDLVSIEIIPFTK